MGTSCNHPQANAGERILIACALTDETRQDPERFIEKHQSGQSWTKIAKDNKVPLEKIRNRIDWTPFFQTWELSGKYPAIFNDPVVGKEAKKLFDDAQKLLHEVISKKLLKAQGVIGFYQAATVNDDDIEVARKNTDAAKRRVLMKSVPGDGSEATQIQFRNLANKASYAGQTPPMNIFNPAAWAEFIQAWKRGDFKNKQ